LKYREGASGGKMREQRKKRGAAQKERGGAQSLDGSGNGGGVQTGVKSLPMDYKWIAHYLSNKRERGGGT